MSITAENLCFSYGTHEVLRDVCFHAADGRLLAVLGPNGVGKTTLFRCILGLQKRYAGTITVDGRDAGRLSARELAHSIAYIPQLRTLTFGYSVIDMVLMGTSHAISAIAVPKKKEQAIAEAALDRVGMLPLAEKDFSHLSGGEQQLVLIARALAQQTRILLMDEPTAALDYGNQMRILQAVRALSRQGYTVILSTHNPQHALWFADEALALSAGTVAAFGPPRTVLTAALIEELYRLRVELIQTESGPLLSPAVPEPQNG